MLPASSTNLHNRAAKTKDAIEGQGTNSFVHRPDDACLREEPDLQVNLEREPRSLPRSVLFRWQESIVVNWCKSSRRGGRVAECGGLLNRCTG